MKRWKTFKKYLFNGDWHIHTNWTDGESTIKEIFDQAVKNKLKFIVFSEHVRKEMMYDYMKFKKEVYRVGRDYNIKFAVGCETKVIDEEGNLNISKQIAKESEIILFTFHSPFFKTKELYKKALKEAIGNPLSDIWAHPFSCAKRMGFMFSSEEFEEIAKELLSNKICFEINRKHFWPKELSTFLENKKLPIVFGSDAHKKEDLLTLKDIKLFNQYVK